MPTNKLQGGFAIVLLSAAFLLLFYSDILQAPNDYLFADSGDGIKNYYTYAYHIKNDSSYVYFEGMNYPYGELHVFTDGNPFLANFVKILQEFFPQISRYSIGIYNSFMLWSFCVAAIFLYLILFEFMRDVVWSVAGALAIMVLSPQIMRAGGHFSLVTFFTFPITYYLNIAENLKNPFKHIGLFITTICWFFIHPYLGMISALFILLYALIFMLAYRKKSYWHFVISGFVLPLVIYFFYVKVFDNHSYRGGIPWGFFHYQANINTVFLPNQTFLSVWLQNLGIKISPWEGWAYIGLGGDMVLLFILVYLVKKGVRKNRITLRIVPLPKTLQTAFWASLIILFYSMGFPFNLFKPMADWFSVIQQFRALGRFAWVFYYVIGTVVFYWVYLIARKKMIKQKKTTFYYVVFILTLIYFLEGVPYHLLTKDMITNRLNYFDEKQLPESYQFKLHTVNQYKWQAILPLPFYHLGAEVFTKSAPETLIFQSMIFSYHASVPMMASNGSRTSMEEARKLIQVVSPPNIYKDIAKEMPCHYPLLVLPDSASMNIFEKYYFEQARKISNDVYSLSCEKLFEVNKNYREPECDTVIYLSFDNVSTSFKNERGVFVTEKSKHKTLLAKHVYLPHQTVQKYKVSFWVYYTTIDEALPNMIIETPGRWQLIDFKNPEIIEKDRMRFSGTFELRENETEVAILISGNLLEKKQVYIDDLTICKTN